MRINVDSCPPACNCPEGTHSPDPFQAELRSAVSEWLRSQHITMWGGYFILSGGDEDFDQAVEWLYRQIQQVLERMEGMGIQHWSTCKDCGISAPDVKPRGAKEVPRCEECNRKPKARR